MNTPGCLLALRTDTPRTSRAKNHHEPALFFDHQLIKHHLTGIRHQFRCPIGIRRKPQSISTFYSDPGAQQSVRLGSSNMRKNLLFSALDKENHVTPDST